jgi:hypothetical protein
VSWPFPPFHFSDELAVRTAAIVLAPSGDELNDVDASSIVWEAIKSEIRKAGGRKPLSPHAVLAAADRLAASHFRKPAVDYVLLTTLSVQQLPTRRVQVDHCTITALLKRGGRYLLPDALKVGPDHSPTAKHLTSTKYRTIKIRTTGRSVFEATDRALDGVNFLRGLWTLFATFGSWRKQLGGMPKRAPIGVIHTGPIHTLHHLNGKPAADIYWYEPDYIEDRPLFTPKNGWRTIEKNRRWSMRRTKLYAYRRDLQELIVKYAIALDNADLNVAFLQMWSMLEKITDTERTSYDETIRRATWASQDRDTARELLEHLRFRRNQYVHAAK